MIIGTQENNDGGRVSKVLSTSTCVQFYCFSSFSVGFFFTNIFPIGA